MHDDDRMARYAKIAGVLGLLSIIAGAFGEAYVPARLVFGKAPDAMAASILTSETLFRYGFAAYMVEAVCDASLTLLFYLIFRAVREDLALLSVFFRLLGTAGFAMSQVFYFAALPTVSSAGQLPSFTPEQLNTIATLLVRLSGYGQTLFTMFYGVGSILLGYLMYRSAMLPRVIGVLFGISGITFVLKAVTWALAPAYSSPLWLTPAAAAALALTVWLLLKGVDVTRLRPQHESSRQRIS